MPVVNALPKQTQSAQTAEHRRATVLLRGVLTLTFLVYLRTITFDFVFDDHLQISLNPWLESWRQVPQYFTHQLWAFTDMHTPASYYRPLFMTWLATIQHVTGGAPGWYHLATVLLHLVVVIEAFLLARLLVNDELTAVFAAALWALHPAKIEAVAWISGGGEPLFAAFFFGIFIAYLKARFSGKRGWTAVALVCFVLALLSKEQAIVAPAILLAYEWWRERLQPVASRVRNVVIAVAPFAIAAGAFWALRWHIMHGVTEVGKEVSVSKTLLTQPKVWLWYVWHMVWPFSPSLYYPEMIVRQFSLREFLLPCVLVLTAALLIWLVARKSAEGVLLFTLFVCTLAPPAIMVLLIQPHDRYLYLPSFAAAVGIAVAIRRWITRESIQVAATAAICAILAIATFHHVPVWDNDVSLMENAVAHAPDVTRVRVLLASSYTMNGDPEKGIATLMQAAERDPKNMDVWQALAVQEYSAGNYGQAYEHFKRALDMVLPGREGPISYDLGLVAQRMGRSQEAEQWTRRAIAVEPTTSAYHRSLATILVAEGRSSEADQERELARKLQDSK